MNTTPEVKKKKQRIKKDKPVLYNVAIADEMNIVIGENTELKRRIKEALHLLEFHKHLCGEEYVRQSIINKLKKGDGK